MASGVDAGHVLRHGFGNRIAGETVFVPRESGENEGYLATFVYDPTTGTSETVLIDAAQLEAEPVATIRIPQRVLQGLHGTWIRG